MSGGSPAEPLAVDQGVGTVVSTVIIAARATVFTVAAARGILSAGHRHA
ncbi:MAG: hypothetical protein ACOCZB_02330 [Spirochaetota bacterium]